MIMDNYSLKNIDNLSVCQPIRSLNQIYIFKTHKHNKQYTEINWKLFIKNIDIAQNKQYF